MKKIEDKKTLNRLKVLTVISGFGLGVCALLGAYIIVEFADESNSILKGFASLNGIMDLLKQMLISGVVYAVSVFCVQNTLYKMKFLEDRNNWKNIIKISAEMIIEIIVIMIILLFLNIESIDVGAVYSLIAVFSLILFSIVYITKETVEELNKKLSEKKKKDISK